MGTTISDVEIKASILSNGIAVSPAALEGYGPPFLGKRRAYGNQDPLDLRSLYLPQEAYILPSRLVVAMNIRQQSCWQLDLVDGSFCVSRKSEVVALVDFPLRPAFYDKYISDGLSVAQVATLYGGKALGIFAYGDCVFAQIHDACQFCSLSQNRQKGTDFVRLVTPAQVQQTLEAALEEDETVSQVMINGGTLPDLDDNFRYYAGLVRRARGAIDKLNKNVELHLIVCPPRDLSLVGLLKGLNAKIAINMEVFSTELFETYCPGKSRAVGRDQILAGLCRAVEEIGAGNVYSILVGGLEPLDELAKGIEHLGKLGVVPVINVLHTDPETPLEGYPNPGVEYIMNAGRLLQVAYREFGWQPFYEDCGRNSIDTEAYRQLF